jgi:hypothetical protein
LSGCILVVQELIGCGGVVAEGLSLEILFFFFTCEANLKLKTNIGFLGRCSLSLLSIKPQMDIALPCLSPTHRSP